MSSTSSESARERFYRLRSDRTMKCLDGRLPQEIHCTVSAEPGWAEDRGAMPALETLCNLLGRFCRNITVVVPTSQQGVLDGKRLLEVLHLSDPYGNFNLATEEPDSDLNVRLGSSGGRVGRTLYWRYRGWTGFISNVETVASLYPTAKFDSPGAEMAACLAGAGVFHFWVHRSYETLKPFGICLFNLAEVSEVDRGEDPELDPASGRALRTLLVGAGSVGSAAAYFLPRLGVHGTADIVDHDIAIVENLDRSPLFTLEHVDENKAKATAAYLCDRGIVATAHQMRWDEFVASQNERFRTHDLWLPLANEYGVRRAMQANYPPVSFQSSTGRNWNVQYGRHIPFSDDCQVDRFPNESSAPLICATGQVESSTGKKEDAALPFASFMAGLFVASGVLRFSLGRHESGDNAAYFSAEPQFSLWTQSRGPRATCICQEMSKPIWNEIWSQAPVPASPDSIGVPSHEGATAMVSLPPLCSVVQPQSTLDQIDKTQQPEGQEFLARNCASSPANAAR